MGLDKIVERLAKEKEEKVLEIKTKTEKELEKILKKRKEELELWKEERKKKIEEALLNEENIALAKKRLQFKDELSLLENQMILRLKEDVLNKFLSLNKEEYQKFWERLLSKEGIESGEIILAKGEEKLDIKELCEKFKLIYKEERYEGKAGLMVRKGNIIEDLTLENIIDEKIKENILELAKILRGE
ncbi:MAG: V-type proton ATPase subunit E [Dictyoglomus sp.]|nr:V-type proton ATPase subunit E [Dictyoglomus sp.]MCX7942012.1 V-type proton ATPase subunit E [Dictyoglomaceae bacterium]MDW8188726.1 V-type proton ATPase subunit E [Dictyoglomus sp.]